MTMFSNESILGYRIADLPREGCIGLIVRWLVTGKTKRYFACVNPHSLMVARKDRMFQEALQGAGLLVPDGFGVVIASMILMGRIRERVTGSDIFLGINRALYE